MHLSPTSKLGYLSFKPSSTVLCKLYVSSWLSGFMYAVLYGLLVAILKYAKIIQVQATCGHIFPWS